MRKKLYPKNIHLALRANIYSPNSYIFGHWHSSDNFGDACSPICIELLSSLKPINHLEVLNINRRPVYSAIGSVLSWTRTNLVEVWGSGFLADNLTFRVLPRKIHAVRGPLTRKLCLAGGINCPDIYGDPAVIIFNALRPEVQRIEHELGVLPHYCDSELPGIKNLLKDEKVKIIDVKRPIREVVSDASKCRYLASSSLHGLILADCLEIPSTWLRGRQESFRGGFKFIDYYASRGFMKPKFININNNINKNSIIKEANLHGKIIDVQKLLEVCPFRSDSFSLSTVATRLENILKQ